MTVIPVESDTVDTNISTRFGKAPWFAFVHSEGQITMEPHPDMDTLSMLEWFENKGVSRIITAHIGPKPFDMLQKKQIKVFNPGKGNMPLIHILGMMEIGKLELITAENIHRFYTDNNKGDT